MSMTFELLLVGGAVVRWDGRSGEDAAQAYVAGHPGVAVVAWRQPRYPISVLGRGRVLP